MANGAQPYSDGMGDLIEYLREHDGGSMPNLFSGSKYYFVLKEKNLLVPGNTSLRVNGDNIPDELYFVNEEYNLESRGPNEKDWNMSCNPGPKGVHDPEKTLEGKAWQIDWLNFEILYSKKQ